MEALKRLCHLA